MPRSVTGLLGQEVPKRAKAISAANLVALMSELAGLLLYEASHVPVDE